MKKNVMMRVASALLVAVLMTTCAISGTFAKYTTNGTATDTARVAKFGVTITASGEEVFAENYDDVAGDAGTKVKSTVDVVAPGTEGSLTSIKITGTPEVAVNVTYAGTLTLSNNWVVAGDFYCPITIKVNGTPFTGTNYDSADDFKAAVEAEINGYSKQYAAGTDLSTKATEYLAVTWEWAFRTGADDAAKDANDVKDTVLGNKAVAEDLTITLAVTTTVTQED